MGLSRLRSSSSSGQELKGRSKFEKKLAFYSKVKETVTSLAVKKGISKKNKLRTRQKKLKAYDLSTLSEFLPDVKSVRSPPQDSDLKLNCKSRRRILEKESAILEAVLSHPVFKSDPISAIHQHLQSTQPPSVNDNQVKRTSKTDKKKGKKKHSSASSSQSMEM
ncbi:hypothetical protein H6P81_001391 [Aristolochia fimbriata]|uniref:Uncharacterized protein n=1 Tax=Aristolochia fimbriata TaxID=158543 RepID=A0AAV7F7D0_ARIFI|nr:hypothetical protein H6P81_001391 [Aristolochia fimbriata]